MPFRLTLRLAFAATILGCAPLGAEARPAREAALSPAAGVSVDVSRLKALGLGPTADLIAGAVAQEAGSLNSSRGRVVLVLTGFNMASYAGSGGGEGGGGGAGSGGNGGSGSSDFLEGDVLIVGPGGQVLASHHQVVSLPASSGGAYYLPGAERRRVIAVSQAFAEWARRAML